MKMEAETEKVKAKIQLKVCFVNIYTYIAHVIYADSFIHIQTIAKHASLETDKGQSHRMSHIQLVYYRRIE